MTWYLLAHVIYRLYEKTGNTRIRENTLSRILLRDLWVTGKTSLYDNMEQLRKDLRTLESFNIINKKEDGMFEINVERLKNLEETIMNDPILTDDSTYYLAYLRRRIDEGLERILR
ncbi:MAG: hypothetical protein GXO23_07175 [Crenarchaeota archaeon]|nr:hypothetical protein [Thermoproteota archaeon]